MGLLMDQLGRAIAGCVPRRKPGRWLGCCALLLGVSATAAWCAGWTNTKSAAPRSYCRASSSAAVEKKGADDVATKSTAIKSFERLEGDAAKQLCRQWLADCHQFLGQVKTFKASFYKQERVGGRLQEAEELVVKMRQSPLSVYMAWDYPAQGRELLWHRDQHEGKLLIHESGWKGRMVPLLKLALDNPLVTSTSRRPVSELGLWELAHQLKKRVGELDHPLAQLEIAPCQLDDERQYFRVELTHPEPVPHFEFHKIVLYIDEQWKVAVGCECYDWPIAGQEAPLLESYLYQNINLNSEFTDTEFDHCNPQYQFVRSNQETTKR